MFFLNLRPDEAPTFGPGLARFEVAIDLIRAIDPIMPIGAAASLVHVARRLPALYGGDLSLGDVAREMDLNYATFMRNADLLADGGTSVRRLNLFEKGISPSDRRARHFRPTEKGLALLHEIERVIASPTTGG